MISTYSHTALNTFRYCPQKFKFKYVDRVQIPKKVTADLYMGSVVHQVLSKLYKLGSDGIVYPVDDMIAFYEEQWEKVERQFITLTDDYHTVDDYIRLGCQMLGKHYESYQPFDQGTLLGTELNVLFTLPDTPFKIRAVIDRLWKREDSVVEICDYKTGKTLARPQDESFYYQMGLYQLAVQANYPQFETIELAQYFLRMGETVRYRMRPDELERLVEDVRVTVIETINAERLDNFPAKESPFCNYCDYFSLCPAKRHQLMLDKVKGQNEAYQGRTPEERAYALTTEFIEVDQRKKQLEVQHAALRSEIIQIAKEMNATKLAGAPGMVHIKLGRKEEFITKSGDYRAFAELSHLAHQFGLNEYFILDGKALMKEIYGKRRLSEEQLKKLKPFVVEKERAVVMAKPKRGIESEDD